MNDVVTMQVVDCRGNLATDASGFDNVQAACLDKLDQWPAIRPFRDKDGGFTGLDQFNGPDDEIGVDAGEKLVFTLMPGNQFRRCQFRSQLPQNDRSVVIRSSP